MSELAEEDILQTFLKERELDGDIISKVSDILWLRNAIRLDDAEADVTQQPQEVSRFELNMHHGLYLLIYIYIYVCVFFFLPISF